VKYFWTVPGFDRRKNEPGSVADGLEKQYRQLLKEHRSMREVEEERADFWRDKRRA
jgi:hypothetical protein